jgi:hypothetical protein
VQARGSTGDGRETRGGEYKMSRSLRRITSLLAKESTVSQACKSTRSQARSCISVVEPNESNRLLDTFRRYRISRDCIYCIPRALSRHFPALHFSHSITARNLAGLIITCHNHKLMGGTPPRLGHRHYYPDYTRSPASLSLMNKRLQEAAAAKKEYVNIETLYFRVSLAQTCLNSQAICVCMRVVSAAASLRSTAAGEKAAILTYQLGCMHGSVGFNY